MDFQKQIKAMADMYNDGYKTGLKNFATRLKAKLPDFGNIVTGKDVDELLKDLEAEVEE